MRRALIAGALALGGGLAGGLGVASAWPALASNLRPCLDVGIPPGLPFEWEQPAREPTESLKMRAPAAAPDPGATRLRQARVESHSRPRIYAERTTAMGYARVTTVDILTHFSWDEGPQVELVDKPLGRSATGAAPGPETSGAYPPAMTLDLYWVSLAMYLRALLHPNQISEGESLERLVEMGYPALCVLHDLGQRPIVKSTNGYVQNMAAAQARLEAWQATLRKRVGPLPAKRPRALGADEPERALLLRVTADDLAGGYASSIDPDFGARILSLPVEEALPLLLAYATPHTHDLLRRNATTLLGSYASPEAKAALELLVKSCDDEVTRLRAFAALARQGSPEATQVALQNARRVPALVAVNTLGLLRAREGSSLALKLLRKGSADEVALALRALGRMGDADKQVLKAIERKVKALRKLNPQQLYEVPAFRADVPDTPFARRDGLIQLGLIALARLGDTAAQEAVLKLLSEEPPDTPTGRDPLASRGTFGTFSVSSLAFLVESLEYLGEPGQARLRLILADRVCDVGLRLAAWRALDRSQADTSEEVLALLKDGQVAVRAEALRRQALSDPGEARSAALRILRQGAAANSQEQIAAADILGVPSAGKREGAPAQVIMNGAQLYAAPNAQSKLLTPVPIASLTVFGEAQAGWYEAEYAPRGAPAQRGWIKASFLRVDLESTPDKVLAKALGAVPPRASAPAPGSAPGGGNPTLVIEHPLGEALARALGNHDTPAARAALATFLQDEGQAPAARAAAAAALSQSASPEAKAALRAGLGAREGWVRYACARALRHQGVALEVFCDWVYGSEAELAAARAQLAGK